MICSFCKRRNVSLKTMTTKTRDFNYGGQSDRTNARVTFLAHDGDDKCYDATLPFHHVTFHPQEQYRSIKSNSLKDIMDDYDARMRKLAKGLK